MGKVKVNPTRPGPRADGTTSITLGSLTMAAVQMLVGMGREGGGTTLSLSLSGAKDYGQDHKSCTTTHDDAHSPLSSFPLSPPHSTPGKGTVLKPLEVGANEGMGILG